jgi:hypothetical protein
VKTDIGDAPVAVPRKRRQLEKVPDLWIAQWLARDTTTPSERRKLEAIKQSRRNASPDNRVGLLIGDEGVTPQQFDAVEQLLRKSGATQIHHAGVTRNVHSMCRAIGVEVVVHDHPRLPWGNAESMKEVVRESDLVVGAPRSGQPADESVWELLRYAKHRRTAVRAILPDGGEYRWSGSEAA